MKTKDLIIQKALDLFAVKGYNGASVRNICGAVGIKESSFYNHFVSKEALLNTIFEMCHDGMVQNIMTDEQREELTDKYTLRELLNLGLDNFFVLWADPVMSRIWQVVSMEQYVNPVAGKLIMDEDTRKITGVASLFDKLQMKSKMKPCNSLEVSHLYTYSIRAQHLDYGLRLIYGKDAEASRQMMYRTCDLFCSVYEP